MAGGDLSRREFVRASAAAFVASAAPSPGARRQEPRFDLLIKGGHVIDPTQGLSAIRDVGVLDNRIARVAEEIPADQGRQLLDAGGRVVTPGLIDAHVHVYEGVARFGIDPDVIGVARGVTSVIDGGSSGAITFPGFREYVAERARTRVYALLNIAESGMVVANETADLSGLNPDAAVRTIVENRDVVVGLKVRMLAGIPEGQDLEVMRRARTAADEAGVPITVHIGGQSSPLGRIIELLRPGDIITHALRRTGGILGDDGLVRPEVRDAVAAGIHLDVGHGRGNFDFDVAEQVLSQGVAPTVISSDVHRGNSLGPVFDLPTTLSKLMHLGMSLEEVVAAATAAPASIFELGQELGTLRPGATADLAIFDLVTSEATFLDSGGKTRRGERGLVPFATILDGRAFGSINN